MYKKIVLWVFFTVVAGLLPIGFVLLACNVTDSTLTLEMICSEIFFFDLIMAADGLKEINNIKKYKKAKITLFCVMLFVLIIISVVYGISLINNYAENLNLNLEDLYSSMGILTGACIIIDFCIQIMGGAGRNE